MLENPLKEVLVKSALLSSDDRQYLNEQASKRKARETRYENLSDAQKIALRRFADTGEGFGHHMVEHIEANRFTSPGAEAAYQKAKEARKAQGIQKLIQFAKTGQNGQYWMNDHFLKGYGVSMEDLKKPHVQKAILAAVDKNDLNELRYALPDKVLPTNEDYQYDGLLEALAEGIKGGKFTDQSNTADQKVTTDTQGAPTALATPETAAAPSPAPAATPLNTENPVTLNAADPFGATEKTIGTDIGYTYKQQEIPEVAELSNPLAKKAPASAATPAAPEPEPEQPAKTKTPAGLTREETMQFLEQGYVPTSNGGFMLHEQQAANMLKRMQQTPDYNPGQTITDASRLNRIRNNMLGNHEYTAQGRQQIADDMVYQKAMYHKKRQDELAAANNAAMEQYRGQLTNDARANYLRRGELDYQRSIASGAPLTPAAQWYQSYSNAEVDGKPLPDLPAEVQNGIDQGMHKFRGQLAAQQKPAVPVPASTRSPHRMTQQEMDAYAKAHAANNSGQQAVDAVGSWDPNRLKAAQERHNKAISSNNTLVNPVTGSQPAQSNNTATASTPGATPPAAPTTPTTSTGTASKQPVVTTSK